MHDGSGRIVVQALTKRFGSMPAIDDLSFTVQPGTVCALLGPPGSGKTTTLRAALGLVTPDAGSVTIGGARFGELDTPARVVGGLLDGQGFHPGRSARDHLRCYAAAIGVADTRVERVLELTGLTDVAGRAIGGYPRDMRRRLAIATALLGDPSVLVLDRPDHGLDPAGAGWLRGYLRTLARGGGTVLVTGQRFGDVEPVADQVVVISGGRSVYQGGPDALHATQRNQVLVACSDPAGLARALAAQGVAEIDALNDGRIAVTGAAAVRVGDIALQAGVAVYGMVEHTPDPEQPYRRLLAGGQAGSPAAAPPAGSPAPAGGAAAAELGWAGPR